MKRWVNTARNRSSPPTEASSHLNLRSDGHDDSVSPVAETIYNPDSPIQPFWIQQVVAQTDPLEWKFTPPGPGPYYDPTTLTFEIPGYETDIEWYYSAADDVTLSSYYRDADGNWVITLDSPSFLSPVYVSPTPDN